MPEPILLFRLMAEVANAAAAEAERQEMMPHLTPFAVLENHVIEQYWKIPEYWEIALYLRPLASAQTAFEQMVHLAAEGWVCSEPDEAGWDVTRWAVWNHAPGLSLLTPRIRWAALDMCYPES